MIGNVSRDDQLGRGSTDDATGNSAGPMQLDDAVVDVPVEQIRQGLAHAAVTEIPVDVGIEVRHGLRREHEDSVLQGDPPQMAREVDDLGARGLRHLDVARLGHTRQFGDHKIRPLDVFEHVRANGVVEDLVGEGHLGCVGVEQRPIDARCRRTRTLTPVLVTDEVIEQDIGTPVRLVAAADIQHQ